MDITIYIKISGENSKSFAFKSFKIEINGKTILI